MVKNRSIGACIVLSLVTCGIYTMYWLVCLANDVNTVTGRNGRSGGMVLVLTLVTCGIYGLVFLYCAGDDLDKHRFQNGEPTGNLALLYLLLGVFGLGLVAYALMQKEINEYAGGNASENP
jgi:TctA family transporter